MKVMVLALVCTIGCSDSGRVIPDAPADDAVTPYTITTSKGVITLETHHSWSPNGVDRFADLVAANFYNDTRFFRVVPDFVVQFGINGTPTVDAMWSNRTIEDDPVAQSNVRGYVTYAATAAANSRTTQLFINLGDNSFLDDMKFAPFAVVTSGMDVVESIYSEYGEQPDQQQISSGGNAYLMTHFPNLDYIETVTSP
ncbi:MAG TPA: peptidylprolyl isomerase [Kofleriaceae bacterium]|jgi:cyclophilin family peptidyl-prolyl cis-trans isomerase